MDALNDLLKSFVTQSQKISGDNLIGIYLHGSAVMGCYNEKKSDIDLLVVVKETIPDNIKHRFMDMVVELNTYAPPKGIELSIVKREVCNPFVYPTPFELHFSIAHLEWYKTNPSDYIDKMKGTDKDLAAHLRILSKQEGGKWGICNVPEKYQTLIVQALDEYLSDKSTEWDENNALEYAAYMMTQIRN